MKGFLGTVISTKMQSTAIVEVKRFYHYPLYGKIIARKGKIHAHNAINAKVGQQVEIIGCRPYAKTVAFEISKIVNSGKVATLTKLADTNSINKPTIKPQIKTTVTNKSKKSTK